MPSNQITFDVADFEKELARVKKEVDSIAFNDIEDRVDYAVNTLKVVTPVDTGEARSGWKSTIIKTKNNELIDGSIFNDVEHISYLNNGHSKQAPKYFIEQTLSAIGILTPD